jgi:phosphoglycerol transferase MdoB-like AlkP superfamily enzyme
MPQGEPIPEPTLNFLFDVMRDAPERQIHDQESLDAKMVAVFTAASVVIGLAGISNVKSGGKWYVNALLIAAVLAYLLTAVFAFFHLRTVKFRRSLQADVLWQEYWNEPVSEIKHALLQDISEAYAFNKGVLHSKGRTILIGLAGAGVEVFLVGAALILSRLT